MPSHKQFAAWIINLGFLVGLALAVFCLVTSSLYLNNFLTLSNTGLEGVIDSVLERADKTPSVPADGKISDPATLYYLAVLSRLAMARYALLSCGVYAGLAFGFLGFALFLIGIRGEMDAAAGTEGYTVKVARIAPGVFILTCATVLIGFCIGQKTDFTLPGTPTVLSSSFDDTPRTATEGINGIDQQAPKSVGSLGGDKQRP